MTWLSTMMNLFAIASGGALGALARHGLGVWFTRHVVGQTFWSILMINLIGCFAIGVVSVLLTHWRQPDNWTLFLMTGFLGSFTTYSTFALQSVSLLEKNAFFLLISYVFAHLLAGMALCLLGIALAKLYLR